MKADGRTCCVPRACSEAERLWEEEEDDKHDLFNIKTLGNKDPAMRELVQYMMQDSSKGVIIMNAQVGKCGAGGRQA